MYEEDQGYLPWLLSNQGCMWALIWLFCSKAANNEINRTRKRALRTLYRDYGLNFEELLDRDDTKTIHTKTYKT